MSQKRVSAALSHCFCLVLRQHWDFNGFDKEVTLSTCSTPQAGGVKALELLENPISAETSWKKTQIMCLSKYAIFNPIWVAIYLTHFQKGRMPCIFNYGYGSHIMGNINLFYHIFQRNMWGIPSISFCKDYIIRNMFGIHITCFEMIHIHSLYLSSKPFDNILWWLVTCWLSNKRL